MAKGQDQLGHNEIKMGQTMLNYTLQLNIYLTTDFKRKYDVKCIYFLKHTVLTRQFAKSGKDL